MVGRFGFFNCGKDYTIICFDIWLVGLMVVRLIIWLVDLMILLLWYDGNDGRFNLCELKTIIFLWLMVFQLIG